MSENPEKVRTLDDLRAWSRAGKSFAVVGSPVAHSLSPKMHNAAFALAKIANPELASCRYFKFEIAPDDLATALALFYDKGFVGLNLTLPHKVIALPFLKKISPLATIIGATNTLYRDDDLGGFCGDNTDGNGFRLAAESELGRRLAASPVFLLGAGGAARAIAVTALACNCESLVIRNRSRDKAEALATELRAHFPSAKISCCAAQPERDCDDIAPAKNAIVVNATSLGLNAGDKSPLPPELLKSGMVVYDATYGAHVPALVAAARARKIPATDGRTMLAWQGALAFEIWTKTAAQDVFPVMLDAISR